MPQAIILAAGQNAAAATDVTVTTGQATFSIRSTTAGRGIPPQIGIPIALVTDGVEQTRAVLSFAEPSIVIAAPGTWRARRADISAYGVDIQILADT